MYLDDIRMVELSDIFRFFEEFRLESSHEIRSALRAECNVAGRGVTVTEVFREKFFDGYMLVKREVGGEISDAEASLPQYSVNAIGAATQSGTGL